MSEGNAWIASWRLTRRQLEAVARGELPRVWIDWARRDLKANTDPASWYIARSPSGKTVRRAKT